MNDDAMMRVRGGEAVKSREPFYFPSAEKRLFGWIHHPITTAASGWGVVICKAFGYEALCSHRSILAFADAAARLGMPTLRFDYLGTGDSADIDPNADQVETWTLDVANAAAELRRRGDVSRICLLGFRLGGLLAVLSADRSPVDALALIAPVLNGKRYMREMRTARMVASASAADSRKLERLEHATSRGEGLEVTGYALSAASVAALWNLGAPPEISPRVGDLLLIDRKDLPEASEWAQSLKDCGATRVEYEVQHGLVEMMMTAPQFATIPQAMLKSTCNWLRRLGASGSHQRLTDPKLSDSLGKPQVSTQLTLGGKEGSADSSITERAVFLRSDAALFGIVTEPRSDENRRRAVVLLNAGADYHIGPSRIYVSLARRWARRGYCVLRMDLLGLGDSGFAPETRENDVFPAKALEDIAAAIEYMRERYGIRDLTLGGICSGAYHSLRAAAAGIPANRLLMVNAANFFWDSDTMSLDGLQLFEIVGNPSVYRERILSAAAWKRFLTGQVDIGRIALIYLRRLALAIRALLRDMARDLDISLRHDLGRELECIVGRGVRVVFVFARGEPGIDILRLEAGSVIQRLADGCRIRIIDSADHTFTRSGPREALQDVLSEELFSPQDWKATGRPL